MHFTQKGLFANALLHDMNQMHMRGGDGARDRMTSKRRSRTRTRGRTVDKEKKEDEYEEEKDEEEEKEEGIFGAFLPRGSPRLSQRSAAAGLNQNQDNLSHSTSQSRAAT